MNFLEELYFGNIQPCELPPSDSKKYKKNLRTFSECEYELEKLLSHDEKKLFLKLIDAHGALLADACVENFKRGCRFCMEMMHSCFDGDL